MAVQAEAMTMTAGWTAVREQRAREGFRELMGEEREARRLQEIEALPLVMWRGRELRTIWCGGGYGAKKDGHEYNVPPAVLWHLISPSRFQCPYHPI